MTIYNNLNVQTYNFQIPEYSINVEKAIGASIKDMDDGAKTPMVQQNEQQLEEAEKRLQSDTKAYELKFSALSLKAEAAKSKIGIERYNKAFAVTLLSVAVLGAIALPATAAVIGSGVVAATAIPFFIGIAPAGYFTHVYRKEVSRLENEIAAPGRLCKPVKEYVAKYNPHHDLDLKSTRLEVMNSLCTKTLRELANSDWTTDQMVQYRLLDGFQGVKGDGIPFYNRCITLIKQYKDIRLDRDKIKVKIISDYQTKSSQCDDWKRQNTDRIDRNLAWNSPRHRRYENENFVVYQHNEFAKSRVRASLNQEKANIFEEYGRAKANLENWKDQSLRNADTGFNTAETQLIHEFAALQKV